MEAFFAALPSLCPFDATYPRAVTRVRWGPEDRDHLSRLRAEMDRATEDLSDPDYPTDTAPAPEVQFLCLRAIEAIEPRPDRIEDCVVRLLQATCLDDRRKAVMRRLRRCRTVPVECTPDVLKVYRDTRAYVGTRVMAFFTLCRLTGGFASACRAVVGRRG